MVLIVFNVLIDASLIQTLYANKLVILVQHGIEQMELALVVIKDITQSMANVFSSKTKIDKILDI